MVCSPPGPSVHGIFQARILEWVAISSSRGSCLPRNWTHVSCVSCIGRQICCLWATWEAPMAGQYWWGEERVLFCSLKNQLIHDLPLCNCINGNSMASGTSWQRERQLYDNVLGSYILWTYSHSVQGLSISSSHILLSNCKDFWENIGQQVECVLA